MREILTRLPYGLPGEIYRSPMPFSPSFDPRNEVLEAYVQAGVDAVVMLTPEEEVRRVTGRSLRDMYQKMGFEVIYLPVDDFSIPEEEPFRDVVSEVLEKASQGKTVVIHCHAGLGGRESWRRVLPKLSLTWTAGKLSRGCAVPSLMRWKTNNSFNSLSTLNMRGIKFQPLYPQD